MRAGGRWNRQGLYGCLYTAQSAAGAAGEYRKHFVRRGLRRDRDLVSLEVEVEYVLDLPAILATGETAAVLPVFAGMPPRAGVHQHLLPPIEADRLVGDGDADLEHCRTLADWARQHGFLAIQAPSAAVEGELTLPIYPENRPRDLWIAVHAEPTPLNYGSDPFVDPDGHPQREVP
ncbi:MAG: RES family NAD+ phosphorylase [Gemmatimonadota bacterium]|nr:RES family NAD+ phosphorylase [Gemmatimonadota bacterium]